MKNKGEAEVCLSYSDDSVSRMSPTYTLKKTVSLEGIGLFTGEPVKITISPLPKGSGICLQRTDVLKSPSFRLDLSLVKGTPRCTIVGNEQFSVQTVEHIMAALHAYLVDDVLISLSGPEFPVFDGSSLCFVEMLEEAGLVEQGEKPVFFLKEPVFWSKGDVSLVALPSSEYRISYALHYPQSSCIGTQFYSTVVNKEVFKKEIAPCRTFSVYEEILPFIEQGLLKGGSLKSAIVVQKNRVMNPEGLRFPDEMVRHKILDLIGDLCLMGTLFSMHIIAVRSGHYANNAFANELLNYFKKGEK